MAGGKTLDVTVTAAFSGGLEPVPGTDYQAEVDGRRGKVILTRTAETCDGGTETRTVKGLYDKDAAAPAFVALGFLTAWGALELGCYDQRQTWDLVECFTPEPDVPEPVGTGSHVEGTDLLEIRMGDSDVYLKPNGFVFKFGGKSQ